MPPPKDHVRMAHGVERDGLVLEVFDQRPLQIGVGSALQAGVERLEHNLHLVRLAIARDENLREAAAAQPLRHFVAVVDQTVFKFQFRHLFERRRDGGTERRSDGATERRREEMTFSHSISLSLRLSVSLSLCLSVSPSLRLPHFLIPPASDSTADSGRARQEAARKFAAERPSRCAIGPIPGRPSPYTPTRRAISHPTSPPLSNGPPRRHISSDRDRPGPGNRALRRWPDWRSGRR